MNVIPEQPQITSLFRVWIRATRWSVDQSSVLPSCTEYGTCTETGMFQVVQTRHSIVFVSRKRCFIGPLKRSDFKQ